MGIGGIEPVDVREHDQQIRADAHRHERTEGIVVADGHFLGRHGIVLVDDGDRAELKQPQNRVDEIAVASFVPQIFPGQKDLRHHVVILGEELVVDVHQFALSDGSHRLFGGHVLRPLCEVELADAHPDRA